MKRKGREERKGRRKGSSKGLKMRRKWEKWEG
jgi:hypothetical protein